MVKRICQKCNAVFERKSNYEFHINRKFDCVKNTNNKTEENNVFQNFPNLSKTFPNLSKTFQKNLDDNFFNNKNEKCITEDGMVNTKFNCCYCLKTYSSKGNMVKHLKICKVKKENDEQKENIFKLLLEKDKQHKEELKLHKEEVDELKKQNKLLIDKIDKLITRNSNINHNQQITNTNSNNTINNQTNNTQNNNIVMVNFGKEDLSIIDERLFIEKIVKKNNISGVKIPDEVLKIIHFNPQYPQLSNIYISDINREKCMVYEDGEWKLSNFDNIPQIMDKICVFSADQISNLRIKHPNNKPLKDRLNTIEKYNNLIDGDYMDDLRDEGRQVEIAHCEDFQKHTYNTLKKTLYNEGKKLKKIIKIK